MSTTECSACGQTVETAGINPYPDNGWVLPYEEFGYYSGFTDDMPWERRYSQLWLMCHDCVVKFLETFPKLGETINKGEHARKSGTDTTVPCCEWEWRVGEGDKVQIVVNGQWKYMEEPNEA